MDQTPLKFCSELTKKMKNDQYKAETVLKFTHVPKRYRKLKVTKTMVLKPSREQNELEEKFFKIGLDKNAQDLVKTQGITSHAKISKYRNHNLSVPFSATYRVS
jgi:ribosomal 30S subunit maturation factor RimM